MKFAKKLLVQTITLSLALPSVNVGAQDLSKIWSEAMEDVQLSQQQRVDLSKATKAEDVIEILYEQISRARINIMNRALSRGQHNLVGESIRGISGDQTKDRNGRRLFGDIYTLPDSYGRNQAKMRVVEHEGQPILACRHGILDSVGKDMSGHPLKSRISATKRSTNGIVFMQICAGELLEDRDNCGLPSLRAVGDRMMNIGDINKRYKVKGVTNRVILGYTMEDPKGFEGCSSKEGLLRILGEKVKARAKTADAPTGPKPRGLKNSDGNFRDDSLAAIAESIYNACTDFPKLNILPLGVIGVGPVSPEFEKLVNRKAPRAVIAKREGNKEEPKTKEELEEDLSADEEEYTGGTKGSRKALKEQATRDLGPRRALALLGPNYGFSVCNNIPGRNDFRPGLQGPGFRSNNGLMGPGGFIRPAR